MTIEGKTETTHRRQTSPAGRVGPTTKSRSPASPLTVFCTILCTILCTTATARARASRPPGDEVGTAPSAGPPASSPAGAGADTEGDTAAGADTEGDTEGDTEADTEGDSAPERAVEAQKADPRRPAPGRQPSRPSRSSRPARTSRSAPSAHSAPGRRWASPYPSPTGATRSPTATPTATPTAAQGRPTVAAVRPVAGHRRWHVRVKLGSSQVIVRHPSYDGVSSDDVLARGNVSLSGELNLLRGFTAGFEAGYGGGRVEDTLFQEHPTQTTLHSLELGPWVGYRFWDALMPFARVGFAATWGELRLEEDTSATTAGAFAPGFYASAGVELSLPREWMTNVFGSRIVTFGLRFEAGYTYLGELDFESDLSESDITDRYRSELGTLMLRGASLRTSLVVSF